MSCTNDDLPEPDTPVTVTKPRSGKLTVIPLRLFSRALVRMSSSVPTSTPALALGGRLVLRMRRARVIRSRPNKYAAVRESLVCASARGAPSKMISPPRSPGPGPMSSRRSAANMICGSCSTTTNVLPAAFSRCITPMMRIMSRGCRPMDGSSNTKSVLVSDVPSAVVRLMRCTSPPESVRDCRSSVR